MARTFTKLGKEIEIAVKAGGPDPSGNTRLRVLIQNAKAANMPKENVERAIKRAVSKDTADYKEMVYEGYGPHGIAVLVETATDNTTRTVANVRSYFNNKCVFKIAANDSIDVDELELELIDCGVDELFVDEGEIVIYAGFESYGAIQKYLEDHSLEIISGEFERIPTDYKDLDEEGRASIEKLVERLEEDDDVTSVYTNMRPADE